LERFENGQTNSTEEKRIATLLLDKENAKQFPEEAALFSYFHYAKTETNEPSIVKQLFENDAIKNEQTPRYVSLFSNLFKYASILIIVLGTLFFVAQYQQDIKQKEEAKLAYLETKKALFMISREMHNATQKLSKIEDFTQVTQKFINP
jgi:ATP-dependent Zn protease